MEACGMAAGPQQVPMLGANHYFLAHRTDVHAKCVHMCREPVTLSAAQHVTAVYRTSYNLWANMSYAEAPSSTFCQYIGVAQLVLVHCFDLTGSKQCIACGWPSYDVRHSASMTLVVRCCSSPLSTEWPGCSACMLLV
jgi:hypothetical protein